MSDRPEDQDLVKFILDSGGMSKAVLKILIRDRTKAFVNLNFWSLLIHSLLIFGYAAIISVGIPLSIVYFLYLAFWSDSANVVEKKGALTTLAVIAILVGLRAYMYWKDRPPK